MRINYLGHSERLMSPVIVAGCLGLLMVTGCNGKAIVTPSASVTIAPPVATTIGTGETLYISAGSIDTTSSTFAGVAWTVSGTGCSGAACGSLTGGTTSSVNYVAPAALSGTSLTVTITATSVSSPSASANVAITILPTKVTLAPPSSTTSYPNVGTALSASVSPDLEQEGVTWSVSGVGCTGPTCGSFQNSTSSSTLYMGPASINTLTVTVKATSIADPAASASVTLTVPSLLNVFQFTPATLPAAIVGQPYSATVQVSGGTAPYTFTPGTLPSWLKVTTTANTVTFAGTPSATGTVYLQITAVDSTSPLSKTGLGYFTLTAYASAGVGNSLLKGSYTFYGLGWQDAATVSASSRVGYIGSFTADGNGNITGGEMDLNNLAYGLTRYTSLSGSYNLAVNQTGTITLVPPGQAALPITLAVGLSGINGSQVATTGNFVEYDDSTGIAVTPTGTSSGVRVSGILAQQTASALSTSASPLTGSYAFGLNGSNPLSVLSNAACYNSTTSIYSCGPVSVAGNMTLGSGGAILSGEEDITEGESTANAVTLSGSFENAGNTDADGRLTATLNTYTSASLVNWPVDYVVYVVNPQTFYVMSADSSATTSIVSGEAMQQNLPDIAATPFSSTQPFVLYSDTAYTTNYPTAIGSVKSILQLLTVVPTSSTAGSMSGDQWVNTAGSLTSKNAAVASFSYTVGSNGRVVPSTTGEPIIYLVDTSKGFGTANSSSAGEFQFQPQTGVSLIAGTYTFSETPTTSETGPLEAGTVTLPSGGVPTPSTNVALTGLIYSSYSEKSDDESNSAGTLLFSEVLAGTISNTNGLIPASGITLSGGTQACGSGGGGYIISPTVFACVSGTTSKDFQILFFHQ